MTSDVSRANRRPLLAAAAAVVVALLLLLAARGQMLGRHTVGNGSFVQLNHLAAEDLRPNAALARRLESTAAQEASDTAWTGLGMLLAAAGQEEAARAAWRRVDDSARILVWHGVQQTARGADGLIWFERATSVAPDFAEGWFRAARVYAAEDALPAAVRAYERAAALAPDDRDAWYELGSTYAAAGDWEAARRSYLASLDGTAGQMAASNIWYRIGGTYRDQRPPDPAAAAAAYETGLALNAFGTMPHVEGLLHTELGRLALEQEQWPAAVEHLQQALAILPNDYGSLLLLADARWQQAEDQEAFDLLEQAIAVNPQRKPAYFRLARTYEQAGRPDDALAIYRRLLERFPNDERARTAVERLSSP